MRVRIGGSLVLLGSILALLAVGAALAGTAVGLGRVDAAGLDLTAAMAAMGLGSGVLGSVGAATLDGRATRVGLLVLAAGLLALAAGAVLAGLSTTDPLASLPIVALTIAGFCLAPIGALVVGLSLLVGDGHRRIVGGLLAAGVGLAPVSLVVGRADMAPGILPGVSLALVLLGITGVGLLALTRAGAPR